MQAMGQLLDDLAYKHRRQNASSHSRSLNREYPVSMARPQYFGSPFSRFSQSPQQDLSRDEFLRQLQHVSDEYGEPPRKKQKKSSVLPVVKKSPLEAQRKQNSDIFTQLRNELGGHKAARGARTGRLPFNSRRMGNRVGSEAATEVQETAMEENQEEGHAEEKAEEEEDSTTNQEVQPMEPTSNGVALSALPQKNRDEIAELEEKLRAQRLSRASEIDLLFYSRLGERETNTLVEEVLLEELYDVAEDVFDEEEEKSRIKELPSDLLEEVEDALHDGPMEEVIVQKYNVDITRRHLQCLLPGMWLNDEVINFYFQMMSDRDAELVKAGVLEKRSHFFNSFFYTKVSEGGYNFINVRRWTRKIDLFAMDKIFIPVNVGNMHWCMATIFMTEKRIQYYDSMHGAGTACVNVLLRYLRDESEHKKKQKFDDSGWELLPPPADTPQQNNGWDCGVFSCMFADYLSQDLPLSFKQKDIPFHRHRMVLHISRGQLPINEEGL